jgi:Protein of unknown function (DUF3089)
MQDTSATPLPRPRAKPAIRFLWIIAALIALFVAGAVAYQAFQPQIMRWALVPHHDIAADAPVARPDYAQASPAAWVAHPALPKDDARAAPPDFRPAPHPPVDVFFIAPTTYVNNSRWTAALDDPEANRLLGQIARHFASSFNGIGGVYMPRYRQATYGAFMNEGSANTLAALDLAYGDVLAAFDAFVKNRKPGRPFIVAGHSQGSLHLLRLLKERIGGQSLAKMMVGAWVVGWPVSVEADLEPIGLKPCETPQATGCVISWMSYGATGAKPDGILNYYRSSSSLSGVPRKDTRLLCTNPLGFWANDDKAAREANLGALPFAKSGEPMLGLMPALVGAQCGKDGILYLSPNPGVPFAERKLPGENYHAYDYTLFWANIRANAEARVSAFLSPQ